MKDWKEFSVPEWMRTAKWDQGWIRTFGKVPEGVIFTTVAKPGKLYKLGFITLPSGDVVRGGFPWDPDRGCEIPGQPRIRFPRRTRVRNPDLATAPYLAEAVVYQLEDGKKTHEFHPAEARSMGGTPLAQMNAGVRKANAEANRKHKHNFFGWHRSW